MMNLLKFDDIISKLVDPEANREIIDSTIRELVSNITDHDIQIKHSHRSPFESLGRFGGGWQWEVGIQAGNLSPERGCFIINLLTQSIRVSWRGGVYYNG